MAVFTSFTIKAVLDTILFFFVLTPEEGGYAVSKWAADACKDMPTDDLEEFEKAHGDCKPAMENFVFWGSSIFITIGSVITIHFILVLHTYYSQSVVGEEEKVTAGGEEEQQPLIDN